MLVQSFEDGVQDWALGLWPVPRGLRPLPTWKASTLRRTQTPAHTKHLNPNPTPNPQPQIPNPAAQVLYLLDGSTKRRTIVAPEVRSCLELMEKSFMFFDSSADGCIERKVRAKEGGRAGVGIGGRGVEGAGGRRQVDGGG